MPYVSMHIEAEDVLADLSDNDLKAELMRRHARKCGNGRHMADYMIPQQVAAMTLNDAADLLRKHGRNDLAFKLEEVRVDYVGH